MKALLRVVFIACCVLLIQLTPATANSTKLFKETGLPSTGFNRAKGVPIWTYPNLEQFVPVFGEFVLLAGFSTNGAFDPGVGPGLGNSSALTPTTPGDALVATHFDDIGMSFLAVSRSGVPDEKLNIPLDNVEVLTDDFGVNRTMIPCAASTNDPTVITRAAPCAIDITLDTWLSAAGDARIKCLSDGTAELEMRMRGLRPVRMYSVWYVQENFAAGPEKLISAFPFGGVPNTFVTDDQGQAVFMRTLGFCPHEIDQALGWVVALRSNGQNYGGVPVPFLNQELPETAFEGYEGLIPGTVINVQLSFNINGVPVES